MSIYYFFYPITLVGPPFRNPRTQKNQAGAHQAGGSGTEAADGRRLCRGLLPPLCLDALSTRLLVDPG